MPPTVQVGTILVEEQRLMAEVLGFECKPYSGNWGVVQLDGVALGSKIREAGWNLFFMAEESKTTFFGAITPKKIDNALQRILGKVKHQHFNALEVTGIVAKRFLGVPYTVITAHARHIQQSCYLGSTEARRTAHLEAELAKA